MDTETVWAMTSAGPKRRKLEVGEIAARADVWGKTRLAYVDGDPTLAMVLADARAEARSPYEEAARILGKEWSAWLDTPEQFISEGMLEAMGTVLEIAGVELSPRGDDVP